MRPIVFMSALSCAIVGALQAPAVAAQSIEVITVHGDARGIAAQQLPGSATILDATTLQDEGGEHFEQILDYIPNLNWSGGTSRPRYFQIRGVGDQEEYQGAPNSSVGFIVDGIDLSGVGMAASLYDLEQVEVLRGPQGTQYGANALAGLIYIKSQDPTDVFEAGLQTTFGQDSQIAYGGFVSGPASETLSYRLVWHHNQQDGFRDNHYLGRNDTNQRDETTLRGKWLWQPSAQLSAQLTLLYADLDNGYEAWTLDNNGFITLADELGEDSQRTYGGSLDWQYGLSDGMNLTAITSWTDTDARHAYDGDWANPDYWAGFECAIYNDAWEEIGREPCQYDYFWDKHQQRRTISQEVRLSSADEGKLFNDTTHWLAGLYGARLREDNDLESFYNGYEDQFLRSRYQADNVALFGQLDTELGQWGFSVGLRFEHWRADYRDDSGEQHQPSADLWGGHVSASYQITRNHHSYLRVARGYKAGGFNLGLSDKPLINPLYDPETLYNYELGLKSRWLDGRASSNVTLFYMDRQDQQVEASIQDPDSPQNFILYTNNATQSESYGAELELSYRLHDDLTLHGSASYLKTRYGQYLYQDSAGEQIDLSGRELAHAPHYQFAFGATYRNFSGWFANLNVTGKGAFYYSDSHDFKSDAYQLLDAKIGYEATSWSAYLWGRNLTDERYGVRGFYFGNEPNNDWAATEYIRYGDPRQLGVTLNYYFY
ncbi:MAG: TonB-dependent receptor [Ferrimonas sp.]